MTNERHHYWLLVEDNEADINLIKRCINSQEDLVLEVIRDGYRAETFLKNQLEKNRKLPSLILLDINLPSENGLNLLETLKSTPGLQNLPVVILTSSSSPHDRRRSYSIGANSFITKPDNLDEFRQLVTKLHQYWNKVAKLPDRS